MADRFYVNCSLATGLVTLQGAEAHHLAAVSRLRPGDRVFLFNGDGRQYGGELRAIGKKQVEVQIDGISEPQREVGFRLEVAAPLPKGDRAQFLLEKLTELGVTAFVPLQTARSVVHPRETKLNKLERHVVEASKQCGRNVLLRVEPLTSWETYCHRKELPRLRMLAHPGAATDPWPVAQPVALAVGPEGGFTEEEVEMARTNGWRSVQLGPRIVRVETAAIVLASWSIPHGA